MGIWFAVGLVDGWVGEVRDSDAKGMDSFKVNGSSDEGGYSGVGIEEASAFFAFVR